METERFCKWGHAVRFIPTRNDFLMACSSRAFTPADRMNLIAVWRNNAEHEAANAILRMMYRDRNLK